MSRWHSGHSSVIYTKGFTTVDRAGPIAGMGVFFDADHFRAASHQWAVRGSIAEDDLHAEIAVSSLKKQKSSSYPVSYSSLFPTAALLSGNDWRTITPFEGLHRT